MSQLLVSDAVGCWRVAISPSGDRIAIASSCITVYDSSTGATIRSLCTDCSNVTCSFIVPCIAFSPLNNGRLLVHGSRSYSEHKMSLWNTETGTILHNFVGHLDRLRDVQFSGDGTMIASASADSTIKLWSVSALSIIATLQGHVGFVDAVSFSSNQTILASCGSDGVRLWNVADGVCTCHIGDINMRKVVFSPISDSYHLAAGGDGFLMLWQNASEHDENTISAGSVISTGTLVQNIAFAPSGDQVAVASEEGFVQVWNVNLLNGLQSEPIHTKFVYDIVYHPSGGKIFTCSQDNNVRVLQTSEITLAV